MLLQTLYVEIEMKSLYLQATLLVQKGVGTPFQPHCIPVNIPQFQIPRFDSKLNTEMGAQMRIFET